MILILTNIRDFLWSYVSLFFLIGYGSFFIIKNKFFPFSAINDSIRAVKTIKYSTNEGISPLMSLTTALGGTVGIGSIVGVAYAIKIGGCGVVFWMWISGLFGMVTKFSECALAVKYRDKDKDVYVGGTSYILKKSNYKFLAPFFSIICIISSFGTGNISQINGLTDALSTKNIDHIYIGVFGLLIVFLIVIKGQKVIGKANEILMPIASVTYLFFVAVILINNASLIPDAITKIVKNAFGINAIGGGICINAIISSFRIGISKGVFSHEAGMGTSPIAHAANSTATPFIGGILGIFEVFFDIFVVGTMTAIALIVCNKNDVGSMINIYFGNVGEFVFIILLILFAIAAMISWCFYAESCLTFLKANNTIKLFYRVCFSLVTMIGVIISSNNAWVISDLLNITMILPNVFILFVKHKEIKDIINNNINLKACSIRISNKNGGK